MTAAAQAGPVSSSWLAQLELGFENRRGGTVLAHRKRHGPLAVQRPFYPEGDVCHVYLLHPPGGVVGGDELSIKVSVEENARALITTPGAAKFYRSEGAFARQNIEITVSHDAQLEWLPQENILFRGARFNQSTRINLAAGARFISSEIVCLGRLANGESFDTGYANFKTRLFREGLPLQIEVMRIDPDLGRTGPASLRNYPVTGLSYAMPINSAQLQQLRASLEPVAAGDYFGLTLIDDLLIARFLGDSTAHAQQRVTSLWKQLRPMLLDRPACIPRIWKT